MSGREVTRQSKARKPRRVDVIRKAIEELGAHFSPKEAAAILGMSVQGVRKWIQKGTLKPGEDYFVNPTGHIRIRANTIRRIVGLPQNSPSG